MLEAFLFPQSHVCSSQVKACTESEGRINAVVPLRLADMEHEKFASFAVMDWMLSLNGSTSDPLQIYTCQSSLKSQWSRFDLIGAIAQKII